jgi:DNA primase
MYSNEKIDEVLRAVDIVALVRQYVDLKRVGERYRGLCPFHVEKTPSFFVVPDQGLYHCFGCGVGGNAINFMMAINNMRFPEALEDLAQRHGVSLPAKGSAGSADQGVGKSTLYAVTRKASEYFQGLLWGQTGLAAQAYLKERGLSVELARAYRLGLSLDNWDGLRKFLKKEGFSDQAQAEAGLIRPRRGDPEAGFYDVFRNRLMISICDPEGREVAFAGRVQPGETDPELAKYINSPATPIYRKGQLLYGYHQARAHLRAAGLAFLVEGYFDLLALAQAKIPNVVAAMGTALTQGQINLLRGQVKEVYLLFDGDEAGQRAASRALPALLNVELDGKVIILPPGEDPDTFIRTRGAPGLFEAAERATDILDYYANRLMAEHGQSLGGEARALREAREMLARVPDAARGQLLRRKLAEKLRINPDLLSLGPSVGPRPPVDQSPSPGRSTALDPLTKTILAHVIIHPELAKELPGLERIWPQDASRRVFEELKAQFESLGRLEPEKLRFEEDEEIAALISGALLAKRVDNAERAVVVFREMGQALLAKAAKSERARLAQAIAEAERGGDQETVRRLMEERTRLPHPILSKMKPQ